MNALSDDYNNNQVGGGAMLNQNYSAPIVTAPTVNDENTFATLTPDNIELIAQLVKNMQMENVAKASIPPAFVPPSLDRLPLMHFQRNVPYAASCLGRDTIESPTFNRLISGKLLPKDYMCHLCFLKVCELKFNRLLRFHTASRILIHVFISPFFV